VLYHGSLVDSLDLLQLRARLHEIYLICGSRIVHFFAPVTHHTQFLFLIGKTVQIILSNLLIHSVSRVEHRKYQILTSVE